MDSAYNLLLHTAHDRHELLSDTAAVILTQAGPTIS